MWFYCKGESRLFSLQVASCGWTMPRCLSAYACERIICMWQQGKTPMAIIRELARDGICTTLRIVKSRIFAWTNRDGLEDRRRSGWPLSIIKEIAEYMDSMLEVVWWTRPHPSAGSHLFVTSCADGFGKGRRTHCFRISPINCNEVRCADSCTYT